MYDIWKVHMLEKTDCPLVYAICIAALYLIIFNTPCLYVYCDILTEIKNIIECNRIQ